MDDAALAVLNRWSEEEALGRLLRCCGSGRWAERMVRSRPFADEEQLLRLVDESWRDLDPSDWLEAFRAHPRIGEREPVGRAAASAREADWSAQEQSAAARSISPATETELRAANRLYEDRFGYIFIVCATGKTTEEMLSMLNARLENDAARELQVAAGEQRQITRLRLRKLLDECRGEAPTPQSRTRVPS